MKSKTYYSGHFYGENFLMKKDNYTHLRCINADHIYDVYLDIPVYDQSGNYLRDITEKKRHILRHTRTMNMDDPYFIAIHYDWNFYLIETGNRVWTLDEVSRIENFLIKKFNIDSERMPRYEYPYIPVYSANSIDLYSKKYTSIKKFHYNIFEDNKNLFIDYILQNTHNRMHDYLVRDVNKLFEYIIMHLRRYLMITDEQIREMNFDLSAQLIKRFNKNILNKINKTYDWADKYTNEGIGYRS